MLYGHSVSHKQVVMKIRKWNERVEYFLKKEEKYANVVIKQLIGWLVS
jgi:hypothetical protein